MIDWITRYGGVLYGMNQYSGGWWLNTLYNFQDPDLVTFQGDFWFRPSLHNLTKWLSMDSKSRVAKAIVYGGVYKNGDDLTNLTNVRLVQKFMGNDRVNTMWSYAKAGQQKTFFRPVSWGKGIFIPPSTFIRSSNGDIAVFNYYDLPLSIVVELNELNEIMSSKKSSNTPISEDGVVCEDVWDGANIPTTTDISGNLVLQLHLDARTSMLISCR